MKRALVSTIGSLSAALVLHRLGNGTLAAPPTVDPHLVMEWAADRGTTVAAMAALRLAAFAVSTYLAMASAFALLATVTDAPLLRYAVRIATPAALRRGLGLGIVSALVVHAAPAASAADVPVLVQVTAPPGPAASSAPPMLVWTGTIPVTETTAALPAPTLPPTPPLPPTLPQPQPATAPPPTDVWRVERGEHLWGIAAATVRARGGDGQDTVARYWHALVETNRDRLVVPANPDLVFPGQEFVLPPGP